MAVHAQFLPENIGFPFSGSPEWGGGGGGIGQFCFSSQQKQLPQMCLTECYDDGFNLKNHHRAAVDDGAGHRFNTFSQCLTAQVEKQKQEIDHYIKLQNESLRMMLKEQGKQQITTLLNRIESKTAIILRHKEEEIARASKKAMELEIFLRKLEVENQAWQRIAKENEAIALSLNNTLDQMKEKISNGTEAAAAEDAESCCDDNEVAKKRENRSVFSETKQRKTKMICKGCNCRNSCVIFLPCRHLCSCQDCEAVLENCPVCSTPKKASIEALIF